MKKKLMSLGAIAAVSLTLVACRTESVNKIVSYGSLSDNKVYASSNGNSISEKKLYDLMRAQGYETVKSTIKEQLFSDVLPVYKDGKLTNTTYFDYDVNSEDEDVLTTTYSINGTVVSSIYGVTSVSDFKALTQKEIDMKVNKYVDSLFNAGTKKDDGTYFTAEDVKSYTVDFAIDKNGNDVFKVTFPYQFYKDHIYSKAMENYALEKLQDPEFDYYYKNKYVSGAGSNSFYTTEDDVKSYYYNTSKYYKNYKGIVIKFTSQASAQRIISSALGGRTTINPDTALEDYIKIYNLRYTTRDDLTVDNYLDDRYTNLSVTSTVNRLTQYSTDLESVFLEMENGEYFSHAFNLGGTYYLCYRESGEEVVEWENLDDAEKVPGTADKKTVYDETLEYMLKSKSLSSLVSILEKERYEDIVDNKAIDIYDPVYAVKFDADYSDYKLTKTSNTDYVYKFTYNDKEYSLTPEELYEKLEPKYGVSEAVDYLTDKWLLSLDSMIGLVNKDSWDDISDNISSEIKSFNKGKKSYSKSLGVSTYLQLTYGVSTKAEVIDAKRADLVQARISTFFGDPTGSDGSTFNTDFQLIKNFAQIYKNLYDNYFSASISHILIGVDVDGTGSYTNPDAYRDSLPSDALKTKYDDTLLALSNAIIKETNALVKSKKVTEALDYIVEAYNNNYKIGTLSYELGYDVYWNDLKNEFPFALKAEDLGNLTSYDVSGYAEEFADRTKVLYDKVEADEIDETVMDDKGVFEYDAAFADADDLYNKICKTTFGYHMLNIYGTDSASSANFASTSDDKASSDDEYKIYEHLEVVIIPDDANGDEDDDDDPEYVVYANGYSDTDYASVNQLFVYFYETTVVGSNSLLKSSVNSAISSIISKAITFYTNSSFVTWRTLKYELSDLKFADTKNDVVKLYLTSLENGLYSYNADNKYTLFKDYIDGTYNWDIDYTWNK